MLTKRLAQGIDPKKSFAICADGECVVLKFWQWPAEGTTSKRQWCCTAGEHGLLTLDSLTWQKNNKLGFIL